MSWRANMSASCSAMTFVGQQLEVGVDELAAVVELADLAREHAEAADRSLLGSPLLPRAEEHQVELAGAVADGDDDADRLAVAQELGLAARSASTVTSSSTRSSARLVSSPRSAIRRG